MFDLSAGELFLVFIVAVLVLGPSRAANFMRRIARWLDSAQLRWREISQKLRDDHEEP